MKKYIPDQLIMNELNKPEIFRILSTVPDTCLRLPGWKNMTEAIEEIKGLGEYRVVEFLVNGGADRGKL